MTVIVAEARKPIRGSLFLTHGEEAATQALREKVEGRDVSVIIPEIGEAYELPPGAAAKRLRTGRAELRSAIEVDWQNKYADLAVNLKRDLQRIDSDARRVEALAEMREILDRFATPPKVRPGKPA